MILLPREHGAWSMLLQPFVAGCILFRPSGWKALATLLAMLAMFLLKDPLIVVCRQRWIWRERKPESAVAMRTAAALAFALLLCGILHWYVWPRPYLLGFGTGALALTGAAVWLTVRNEQRSIWLQVVSAAGLTAGAPAIALTAVQSLPVQAWILWACSALSCVSGVLTVRALLEARIAAKRKMPVVPVFRRPAWIAQAVIFGAGVYAMVSGYAWIAAAMWVLASLHVFRTLLRLHDPAFLERPLTRVGLEAMAGSIVFTALVVAGLL